MHEVQLKPTELLDCRVLDITEKEGWFCGKLLADLGSDVIKMERPVGDRGRLDGPFLDSSCDPEKNLNWLAYNRGKKGITLDIETQQGRSVFFELVKKVDILLESFHPGYLESVGLGYADLCKVNPAIIHTAVTPFGQSGPYSSFKGSDIVVMAMSGHLYTCGDKDRPPVRASFPMAYPFTCIQAALGSVMALYHRNLTGEGQFVDVSAQQSATQFLLGAHSWWDLLGRITERKGPIGTEQSSAGVLRVWPCKDGWVSFSLSGGEWGLSANRALIEWMEESGMADEVIKSLCWTPLDMTTVTRDFLSEIEQRIQRFFIRYSRDELFEEGYLKRNIMITPVNTAKEVFESPQLEERAFWDEVEHPELGITLQYPGAIPRFHGIPLQSKPRAPVIGEHNTDIYQGLLGMSIEDLANLKKGNII